MNQVVSFVCKTAAVQIGHCKCKRYICVPSICRRVPVRAAASTRVLLDSSSFFTFFYYSSTRNFLLLVTISTSVHLFLVIFGFCEVLMGTSDAHFGTKTFRHWCQTVSRTLRHGCRSVWDTSAPCTG